MKILTASQMREVDRRAVAEREIPAATLMENAGTAVAEVTLAELHSHERRVTVVCGRGNNGGDGLVAARHLHQHGIAAEVFLLGRVSALRDPLLRSLAEAVIDLGIALHELGDDDSLAPIAGAAVIVDAIFGTGFRPPATGLEARAIAVIATARAGGAVVIAVDLPSGLDSDSSAITGEVVTATVTVTFAAPKLAHHLMPAAAHCGRVQVVDIGIPLDLIEHDQHRVTLLDHALARTLLPVRSVDQHKGQAGRLLVIAGSRGKSGAAVLTARAALRAGAGVVTVATPESCHGIVAASCPELITLPLPETADGELAMSALALLDRVVADAVALGPGLGTGTEPRRLATTLLARFTKPTVIDADALNALGVDLALAGSAHGPRVLTPHPGEAGRLLATDSKTIQAARLTSARQLAERAASVTALKGHHTVIATPSGEVWLNASGNPGLATAGSGDVLTGVIGALLAAGLDPRHAAALGVFVHGLAGDLVAERHGAPLLIASDIIEALPYAFARLAAPP